MITVTCRCTWSVATVDAWPGAGALSRSCAGPQRRSSSRPPRCHATKSTSWSRHAHRERRRPRGSREPGRRLGVGRRAGRRRLLVHARRPPTRPAPTPRRAAVLHRAGPPPGRRRRPGEPGGAAPGARPRVPSFRPAPARHHHRRRAARHRCPPRAPTVDAAAHHRRRARPVPRHARHPPRRRAGRRRPGLVARRGDRPRPAVARHRHPDGTPVAATALPTRSGRAGLHAAPARSLALALPGQRPTRGRHRRAARPRRTRRHRLPPPGPSRYAPASCSGSARPSTPG